MNSPRVERDCRARRTAPEEYHSASAGHRGDGLGPDLRPAGGVDGHVRAVRAEGRAEGGEHVVAGAGVHALGDPQRRDALEPIPRLAHDDHAGLAGRGHHGQQAPERAVAEDHHRLTALHAAALDGEERAGERLGEGRPLGGQRRAIGDHVLAHQGRRQRDGLAVGAVDEEQLLAEVGTAAQAEATPAARRRVGGDHVIALAEVTDPRPHRGHHPGQLVPEHRGDARDHDGMSAAERLDVRAARQRGRDLDHDLATPGLGPRQLFLAQIAGSVKDDGPHRVTKTLRARWRCMRSTPSASRSSGRRWLIRSSTRTAPPARRSKAAARSAGDDE